VAGSAYGVDVDDQGNGIVIEPRMYQLIQQQMRIIDRELEIKFLGDANGAASDAVEREFFLHLCGDGDVRRRAARLSERAHSKETCSVAMSR